MKFKNLITLLFLFSASAELAIGRLFDERLSIFGINVSVVLSLIFVITSILFIASIKKVVMSKAKKLLFVFYALIVIVTPILWSIFGFNEFGFLKFINFIVITIPISIIVLECLSFHEIKNLFIILLALVFVLCFFAITGIFETPRPDGRISILGGGPITFARWMGYGVIALYFLPIKKAYFLRFSFIILFLIYSVVSGSRGPFTILLLIFMLYFFLNFRKIFLRFSILFSIIIAVFLFSNISKDISELGRTDRVFLNVAKKGGSNQSTQTRFELADRSLNLIKVYPFGIGAGNWQEIANRYDSTHLMAHEYPHNLIFEIMNEYGVFVGILFLLFILHVSYSSYAKMKNNTHVNSLYPFLFYLWIFLLLNAMLSGSLDDSRLLFITSCSILVNSPLTLKEDE
jgi:O-antigen ligase